MTHLDQSDRVVFIGKFAARQGGLRPRQKVLNPLALHDQLATFSRDQASLLELAQMLRDPGPRGSHQFRQNLMTRQKAEPQAVVMADSEIFA